MRVERLQEELSRRAGRDWELYRKSSESRESTRSVSLQTVLDRREEGCAARWWEGGAQRFAAASSADALEAMLASVAGLPARPEPPPEWPSRTVETGEPERAVEEPPEIFESLAREVSAAARGDAVLTELKLRLGRSSERIENGAGLSVRLVTTLFDGVATAVGRRSDRVCEARSVFRFDGPPDLAALARRLADRATLPLSGGALGFSRGQWLLDPSVAAALLAALSPLFVRQSPPRWSARGRITSASVSVVDDASADASLDGEGTLTRRLLLVERGLLRQRLHDLRSARESGVPSTGHGVRRSFRSPPAPEPRRLFFEPEDPRPPLDLLASVRRGVFASALSAPVLLDLENDRYDVEFTGVTVVGGRAQAPVAGARSSGRLSELLLRIEAAGSDRQFFPMPYPVGAPTLLVERASFE